MKEKREQKRRFRSGLMALGVIILSGGILLYCLEALLYIPKHVLMPILCHPGIMVALVIICLVAGVFMCTCAIWRMSQKEIPFLNEEQYQFLSGDTIDVTKLDRCRTEIENTSQTTKEWQQETHFYKRIKALYECIESGSNGSNGRVVLPRLGDLHEITLHDELSRSDAAGSNIIITFLLILGILGTLTGVHEVLASPEGQRIDVDKLAPALMPSTWAVGGTVILIIMRAIYLNLVDRYTSALDKLTQEKMLPALRSRELNEQAFDTTELEKALRTIVEHENLNINAEIEDSQLHEIKIKIRTLNASIEQMGSLSENMQAIQPVTEKTESPPPGNSTDYLMTTREQFRQALQQCYDILASSAPRQ